MGTIDNSTGHATEGNPSKRTHVTNDASQPIPVYSAPAPTGTPVPAVEYTTYLTYRSGELAGNAAVVQRMPDLAAKLVKIKAEVDNAGNVYIGWSAAMTKANGVTDTSTGYQLAGGDDTGWMPIANLDLLYYLCDNAGDDLVYMVLV